MQWGHGCLILQSVNPLLCGKLNLCRYRCLAMTKSCGLVQHKIITIFAKKCLAKEVKRDEDFGWCESIAVDYQ